MSRDSRERPALFAPLAHRHVDEQLPGADNDWRIYYDREGNPLSMAPFDRVVGWVDREVAGIAWSEPVLDVGAEMLLGAAAYRLGITLSELLTELQHLWQLDREERRP